MPLNPPVPTLRGAPNFTHSQAPLPNHSPAPGADETPSSAHRGHSDPRAAPPALLCPFAGFPLPTQLPYLTPWALHSPLPQSCPPFSGSRNSQDNALRPICLNFVCSKSTINFSGPQSPPLVCPKYPVCPIYPRPMTLGRVAMCSCTTQE